MGGTLADNMKEHEVGAYNESILEKYDVSPSNTFFIPSEVSDVGLHPTQKPLKLMQLLIELTTAPHHIVLDPFCGSGTTLVAATMLGRNYIGIEKDENFYHVAVNRLDKIYKENQMRLFV